MTSAAPFDAIADRYDELWTATAAGRLQREAVWRQIDPLFRKGDRVLDVGCGTGEDALHLMNAGVEVSAFDSSPEMVRIAHDRGVDVNCLAIENLQVLLGRTAGGGPFTGAISNFGALNCVRDIEALREPLAHLIRIGGHLALCVMGRFCLRETLHYLRRGRIRKAVRRWRGESTSESLGLRIYYPTMRRIERALAPDFTLTRAVGIGLCVPPSYIPAANWHDAVDRRLAARRFFRALADHRLLIFVKP